MIPSGKILLPAVLAVALSGLFIQYPLAQDFEVDESPLTIFQESSETLDPEPGAPVEEALPSASSEEEPSEIQEPDEKKMVEIPQPEFKQFIDANDFRDPFFLLRGSRRDTAEVLKPGTTVDGIQFNSYSETGPFIESFYRESHFSMRDVFGKVVHQEWRGGCLRCHRGIEQISVNHKFSCVKCHRGKPHERTRKKAHKGLVSNPSDLEHAPRFCGKCHEKQIEKVARSRMATGRGMINITRYAWGAQPKDERPYSLRPTEGEQPLPGLEEGHAVDRFLRTKCLRCHLQGSSPHRAGDYRATGCAACHMVYANDGISLTYDRAIQSVQQKEMKKNGNRFLRKYAANSLKNQRGYPLLHKFTTAIPSVQCEHCHNVNGVGNEYEGLFGKSARPKASLQSADAEQPVLHGREHEFLLPDIHRERGMHCIDCHGSSDIKGPLEENSFSRVEIRCEDCHGTHDKYPEELLLIGSDPNTQKILKSLTLNPLLKKKVQPGDTVMVNSRGTPMPHVKREQKEWFLFSKVTGKKHPLPVLKDLKPPLAHTVEKHMVSIECHACHARWSANEWGMHVIREESPKLYRWKDWTFSDPTLQSLLWSDNIDPESASMLDWVTAKSTPTGIEGQWVPGVLWDVFTETGWNSMILGKNARGKYSILKPRYQYFLTDRKAMDGILDQRAELPLTLDEKPGLVMRPHTPHTIRKTVRPCESCHENALTAGLGDPARASVVDAEDFLLQLKTRNRVLPEFQLKQMATESGDPIQTTVPEEVRFLNFEEIAALNEKTDRYRALRFINLRNLRFPRLLIREEFPYDERHIRNEGKFGIPRERDLLYDLDKDLFTVAEPVTKDEPEESLQAEAQTEAPEPPLEPSETVEAGEPAGELTEEGNKIIEFFRNLFPGPSPADETGEEAPVTE